MRAIFVVKTHTLELIKMNKTYYVYKHINKETKEVFYVGKGTINNERKNYDRKLEESKSRRNEVWLEYVKSINYNYDIEVVQEFKNEQDALKFEYELQKYYWSIGQCQCSLVYGEEWDKHNKINVWGNVERNKKISNANKGKTKTQEQKEKISNTLKGRYCRENNPNKIKVVKLSLENEFICIYESLAEASRDVNGYASHINRCCNGKLKKHKGFKWMYLKDYKKIKER